MIDIGEWTPNFGKIGKELIDADVLIDNDIEPYASLFCFEIVKCNIVECYKSGCASFEKCFDIFTKGGYLIKKN